MKLKTLKDLLTHVCNTACNGMTCDWWELKQEAIKWVKHWEEEMKEARSNYYCELVGQIREFTNFFNITEEDLK